MTSQEWADLPKRARLEFLLTHYPDYFATLSRLTGTGGRDGIHLLPGMWRHHSVQQLLQLLRELAHEHPAGYRHLKAYYTAETRIASHTHIRRSRRGVNVIHTRQPEKLVPKWVQPRLVAEAVDWLEAHWDGPVTAPRDLLEAS